MELIDLRSDTVTKPTAGMLEAMVNARVGDDVYGDDETVNAFETRVASLFGREAGLFTATGSLANQLALRSLVKEGEELLADEKAHVVRAELGAAALLSGITTRTFRSHHSILDAASAFALAAPDAGPYLVSTKAIAVENTHNFGGGVIQPLEEIKELYELSQGAGIKLHLDGARIWNAHVASGISFHEYGGYFETISVCFSKGLGAPVGSMLLSTHDRIREARIWRKRFGGGMRQIGLLAAAAEYGLDHHLERLTDDHVHALHLARSISALDERLVDLETVQTNIVGIDFTTRGIVAAEFAHSLKERGILVGPLGPHYVRLVTHGDLTSSQIEHAADEIGKLINRA
jgi:threonine aldolase